MFEHDMIQHVVFTNRLAIISSLYVLYDVPSTNSISSTSNSSDIIMGTASGVYVFVYTALHDTTRGIGKLNRLAVIPSSYMLLNNKDSKPHAIYLLGYRF